MDHSEETEALEVQAAHWLSEAQGSAEQAMNADRHDYEDNYAFQGDVANLMLHAQACAALSQAYSMLIIARKPVQR